MSPRNFAKHQMGPYFITDNKHFKFRERVVNKPKFVNSISNYVYTMGKYVSVFINKLFKSPAQNEEPETPAQAGGDQEIDLKQIRAAKQSNQ